MKYSIFINQKRLIELTPDITLKEACVLEYIKSLCTAPTKALMRIEIAGITYTWMDYSHAMRSMPLLKIKSKPGFKSLLDNLENFGFIISYYDKAKQKKFFALTDRVNLLDWDGEDLGHTQEGPLDTANGTVRYSKRGPLDTSNELYKLNNNKTKNETAPARAQQKKSGKFKLSSVETKQQNKRKRRELEAPEHLEILNVYKRLFYKGATARTRTLVDGIPRTLETFKSHFGDDAAKKLSLALQRLAHVDWAAHPKNVTVIAPKAMFSQARAENYLLPLAYNHKPNAGIERPETESEHREIEEANQERNRKRLESLS